MWWNAYGPMPWMFFAPVMMTLFVAVFAGALFLLVRGAMRYRQTEGAVGWDIGCCGPAHAQADHDAKPGSPVGSHSAFDAYRAHTLKRLEQEQGEFQDFLTRLRTAKDQAEFDQFMSERRSQGVRAAWPQR
jgi:Protein of unknown function (DUF2852)